MVINPLIIPTTSAASTVLQTETRFDRPGCLSVIGVLGESETIVVQIPTVLEPDSTNDDHWTPVVQDGLAITLTSAHNAEAIPVGLTVRIVKPATGTAVGLRWS